MKRLKFLVLCFFMGMGLAFAQNTRVTGTVADGNGEPVIGASVVVKGHATVGTVTNLDGKFTLDVPSAAKTLIVKYLGMQDHEVAVAPEVSVTLKPSDASLDEVIVVAYGTTKKSSFTGAVSTIKGETLIKGQTSNVTKSLEGAVAGVQTSSSTGQPGSSANIRIRGFGSISASQSPLIVVDGVPYEGSLNSIAPQDIEAMTVLKDAASNSMYGARGSNGVIMITTKKGTGGKTKINFDGRFGVNSRAVPLYSVITNPADYYEMDWEANRNKLVESGLSPLAAGLQASRDLIPNSLGYNVYKGVDDASLVDPFTGKINPAAKDKRWTDDWASDPFRKGIRQEYNVNVSGGTENTSAYMSLGYLGDNGYVKNTDFERINARVKVDQKFNEHFKAGANIMYAKTTSNYAVGSTGSTSYSNIFMFTQQIAPIYPIYKYDLATGTPILRPDGGHAYDFGSKNYSNGVISTRTRSYAPEQNPLFSLDNDADKASWDNVVTRAYAEIKFLKDFTFTTNIAYDIYTSDEKSFNNPTIGNGAAYGGIAYKWSERYQAINANQLLNYHKEINDHTIDVLLGHETKMDEQKYFEGSKMQLWDPYNSDLVNGGSMSGLTSWQQEYKLEGYLSRLEYNYRNKYYLSGSLRRDASSIFHPDVRWGNFWAVGASWRIKEESFLADVEAVNNLRVKASYGTQGNDALYILYGNRYIRQVNLYSDQYEITSDGTYPAPTYTYRGVPDVTWEKSNNFNVGLELRMFDRLDLTGEFFVKETKDMLYQKPLPSSQGAPTWQWDNQIDMKNTGFELELLVNVIKTNDIKWDLGLNLTSYKNKLTKLPVDKKDPKGYVSGNYWRKMNGSLYDWYTYEYRGVDETTGKSLWSKDVPVDADKDGKQDKDANGDLIFEKETTNNYAEATRYETGKSPIPDMYGGISTNLTVYGFDFSVNTAYQLGGYLMDSKYQDLMSGGTDGSNWSTDIFNRWTPTNTHTDVPRVSTGDQNANALSDRWLTDASYFSLRNVTLGYTLPKRLLSKYDIESLRFYVSVDNLFYTSKRTGLDPRESFSGVVYTGVYSPLRTASFGISLAF